ncbi:MAG: replicative DNA helicase [Candidatus Omnitrophica bacterium]|nr:replicative DNA helicase [Candidatus Omnitrophota bacterium]
MPNEMILDKIPPQNLEAEMAVLGSLLIDEEAISTAAEKLTADSFYKDTHRKIFEAMLNLYAANKAVDLITLTDALKRSAVLDAVGGGSFLTALANAVPTAANINHYITIVKEKSILRSLITNSTKIVSMCFESDGNIAQVVDNAEQLIFEVRDTKASTGSYVPLKEIIKDGIEKIDLLYQKKAHVTGIPTGYIDFDIKTAGLQSSDLIIIAGRPSMGKSAFALGIAEYAGVVEKIPTAVFSLEMSKEQLVQRLLCAHAKVDAHKVRTGYLATSDWPRLTAAAGKLSEAPIFIDDTPAISVMELRAKARRLKLQQDIKLIIVDYLQLMRGTTSSAESRQQEISEISRSLKALARELNVPIIAISQLSRAVESRTDHRPQLSDLRESGAIEQDADVVVLILREEYYNPTPDNQGIAEIMIAKQRNGPAGISVKLAFIKEYTRFENIAHIE